MQTYTPEDLKELEKFLIRIKTDPVYFVEKVIGVTPTWQQREILEAIAPYGAKVSVRSGHGIGKSAVLSWAALWFMITQPSGDETLRIPCTAPSSHQLFDILWPEISRWRDLIDPSFRNHLDWNQDRMWIKGKRDARYAVARTARKEKPEALAGFHGSHVLFIIDEASGVDEAIFETAEGALSTAGARIIMTSNPTRTDGYFYRSQTSDREFWTCLNYSSVDSPLVDELFVTKMAKRYGDNSSVYRVRVLGEFPEAGDNTIIPLNLLEAAVGRDVQYPNSPIIAGVDVARFGSDSTAIVTRRGGEILHAEEFYNKDLMETCGRVMHLHQKNKFEKIYVDSIGLGAGVADRLKELGAPVIPVQVSELAAYKEKYSRMRDELWFQGREFFDNKNCTIPDTEIMKKLIAELSIVTYTYTSGGKLLAESKEQLKGRLGKDGASPNLADAFNLTHCQGGKYQERRRAVQVEVQSSVGWT